jgi:hypothetical protein
MLEILCLFFAGVRHFFLSTFVIKRLIVTLAGLLLLLIFCFYRLSAAAVPVAAVVTISDADCGVVPPLLMLRWCCCCRRCFLCQVFPLNVQEQEIEWQRELLAVAGGCSCLWHCCYCVLVLQLLPLFWRFMEAVVSAVTREARAETMNDAATTSESKMRSPAQKPCK